MDITKIQSAGYDITYIAQPGENGPRVLVDWRTAPYSREVGMYIRLTYPQYWETMKTFGNNHPEIIPLIEAAPDRWVMLVAYSGENIEQIFSTYQLCEYIEATGSQYINTGIYPTQDTGFDLDFVMKNPVSTSGFGSLLGCRHGWNTTNARCYELTTYNGVPRCSESGGFGFGDGLVNAGFVPGTRQTMKCINQVYTNALGVVTTFSESFTVSYPLHIFAMNGTEKGKAEMYPFLLYNGSTPCACYFPVYRKSDGVIGLYDGLRNRFDVNVGSGTFLKGADVS